MAENWITIKRDLVKLIVCSHAEINEIKEILSMIDRFEDAAFLEGSRRADDDREND